MYPFINTYHTLFPTSMHTAYPTGASATREVISFIRHSSLLSCRCTSHVNLFSQPLYSLNSMTNPHFQTTTRPNLPNVIHCAGTPKCSSLSLRDCSPHEDQGAPPTTLSAADTDTPGYPR